LRESVKIGVIVTICICLASFLSSSTPASAQKSLQAGQSQPPESIMQSQSSRPDCNGDACWIFDSRGAYNIRSALLAERGNDEAAANPGSIIQYMSQSNRCSQVNVGTGNSASCSNLGVQSAAGTGGGGGTVQQYMTQSNRCIQVNVGTGNSASCSNLGVQSAAGTGGGGTVQYMTQSNRCILVNVGTGNSNSCSNGGAQVSVGGHLVSAGRG
jgi:hypothetical protein